MVENDPSRVKAMKKGDGSGSDDEDDNSGRSLCVCLLVNGYKRCICVYKWNITRP